MTNVKKLNLTNINKLDSSLNEKKTVYLNIDGERYQAKLDLKFRRSKINKMLFDFISIIEDSQKKGISEEDVFKNAGLFETLAIKHFSDIPISGKIDTIEKLVQLSEKLLDLGITEALFSGSENGFEEDQVQFLKERIAFAANNIEKAMADLRLNIPVVEVKDGDDGEVI